MLVKGKTAQRTSASIISYLVENRRKFQVLTVHGRGDSDTAGGSGVRVTQFVGNSL